MSHISSLQAPVLAHRTICTARSGLLLRLELQQHMSILKGSN